jgi:hypothetical protein
MADAWWVYHGQHVVGPVCGSIGPLVPHLPGVGGHSLVWCILMALSYVFMFYLDVSLVVLYFVVSQAVTFRYNATQ